MPSNHGITDKVPSHVARRRVKRAATRAERRKHKATLEAQKTALAERRIQHRHQQVAQKLARNVVAKARATEGKRGPHVQAALQAFRVKDATRIAEIKAEAAAERAAEVAEAVRLVEEQKIKQALVLAQTVRTAREKRQTKLAELLEVVSSTEALRETEERKIVDATLAAQAAREALDVTEAVRAQEASIEAAKMVEHSRAMAMQQAAREAGATETAQWVQSVLLKATEAAQLVAEAIWKEETTKRAVAIEEAASEARILRQAAVQGVKLLREFEANERIRCLTATRSFPLPPIVVWHRLQNQVTTAAPDQQRVHPAYGTSASTDLIPPARCYDVNSVYTMMLEYHEKWC